MNVGISSTYLIFYHDISLERSEREIIVLGVTY